MSIEDQAEPASGRPTKYRDEFADQARKACEMGARDIDLAQMFEVSIRTVHHWKLIYPSFHEALKVGKGAADDAVERSLFEKATGYSHEAIKFHLHAATGEVIKTPYIEHCQPDTTAQIFWLKNRRPALWRDKHEVTSEVTVNSKFDASKLSRDERQVMRELLLKGGVDEAGDDE